MSKEKIKIAIDKNCHPSGKPLMAVVEYCLERGSKVRDAPSSSEHVFNTYRDGYGRCILITNIPFQVILDTFSFPEFVEVGNDKTPYLWDKNYNSNITFTTFENEERRQKESQALDATYEARREARRKNRQVNKDG